MNTQHILEYIARLPIEPEVRLRGAETDEDLAGRIDLEDVPDGVVTGGNLVEFDGDVDPVLRSSVVMSLLAAQRVADKDPVITTPDQWLDRHNTVLGNLNWLIEGGGSAEKKFDNDDVAVHEAIVPFLTAALGGAVAGASLIITALNQLNQMDQDKPWITLFSKESRRFDVSEFLFTRAVVSESAVRLNLAAIRFSAEYGHTQVLFFKIKKQRAEFEMTTARMVAESELLKMTHDTLKVKLAQLTGSFIKNLDL